MTSPKDYREIFDAAPHAAAPHPDARKAWLPRLKIAAIEQFEAVGFPTTRDEDWHFTSVTPIAERTFKPAKSSVATTLTAEDLVPFTYGQSWHLLVFVNGHYEPALSSFAQLDADVRVMTFSEALKEAPELLAERLGTLAPSAHAFTALNTAFLTDGVVIHVPRDIVVDEPVHILYLTDAHAANTSLHPRTLVVTDHGAQLTLIESFSSIGTAAHFTNHVAEVVVGDGARVDHYKVQRESGSAFHVGTTQAVQGRDSIYHSFSFATGAQLSRTNVYSRLLGENAEVRLNGLYALEEEQHADHQTFVEHIAPSCSSREVYKGIMDGTSHGVFNGKVFVHPEAQKTDGKQTNKALLLSEGARVDTKPQLEIFADDVKCTHGATVGRLDEMALFYMKSRGIGGERARALLTYAFAAEVLELIELEPLKLALEASLFGRFIQAEPV
ncbi:MAG: Fe-S cluster assembly protein SufD [Gemmatimonadetes bacterium]|nr:Fe-S cluster assembly protein SufD [Gemmatimonadota bacterium]